MPHTIRLRDPWEFGPGRSWLRQFGLPTGLTSNDRVWLVVDRPLAAATVGLNDTLLGEVVAGALGRFDVTNLLRPRNVAVVGLDPADDGTSSAAIGAVRLEIESAAM